MSRSEADSTVYYSPHSINREAKWITLTEMIAKIQSYADETITFLESYDSEVSDLEDKYNDLEKENDELKDKVKDLESQVGELEDWIESLQDRIDSME
jgi:peptidoglycan hydrolase CwlO-like protein